MLVPEAGMRYLGTCTFFTQGVDVSFQPPSSTQAEQLSAKLTDVLLMQPSTFVCSHSWLNMEGVSVFNGLMSFRN